MRSIVKKCNGKCKKKDKDDHCTGTLTLPIAGLICNCFPTLKQVYLPNIPNWDWSTGDSIICFAELKLGFMAQSCLVPGLSTLLTSLFIGKENTEVNPLTWLRQAENHTNVTAGHEIAQTALKAASPAVEMLLLSPSGCVWYFNLQNKALNWTAIPVFRGFSYAEFIWAKHMNIGWNKYRSFFLVCCL